MALGKLSRSLRCASVTVIAPNQQARVSFSCTRRASAGEIGTEMGLSAMRASKLLAHRMLLQADDARNDFGLDPASSFNG